ncbi:alcohol dehydrogenase [Flagelloscypha sp. PMI_526]|nr:alcohol dehydrogenase [Flagelloscypha sp. PMI_526]
MSTGTQRALRWHPPSYAISVEDVPIPQLQHPDDAIVKIQVSGLCGSDLHIYRGSGGTDLPVHISGHEFIGEIVQLGTSFSETQASGSESQPKIYSALKIGDKVVSPFTTSCGKCSHCKLGFTSRCDESLLFGSPSLDGGQAQYIRVPHAGATLFNLSDSASWPNAHPDTNVSDSSLLLLADILPTGLFAAIQAFYHPKIQSVVSGLAWPYHISPVQSSATLETARKDRALKFAIIGLGPVGICALVSLLDILHKSDVEQFQVVAIDLNEGRRNKSLKIYQKIYPNAVKGDFITASLKEAEKVFGSCNAVLEVVGNPQALKLSFDLASPFGVITSVGVHSPMQEFPLKGVDLYAKNISLDFGRCPARSMVPPAFELLVRRQDIFGTIGEETSLIEQVVPLSEAVEAYRAFDKGEVGKTLFTPW